MDEQSWTSCKVSWRLSPNPGTLRSMEGCFCCLHAARARGLMSPASGQKNDYHSCTTRHAATVLAERLRGVRTLRHLSGGGSRARAAAPGCLGALRCRYGRFGHVSGGERLRAAGATVAHMRVVAAHRRLSRSVLPMDRMHARGGVENSLL